MQPLQICAYVSSIFACPIFWVLHGLYTTLDHRNKQYFKSKLDTVAVIFPLVGHHAKDENQKREKRVKSEGEL